MAKESRVKGVGEGLKPFMLPRLQKRLQIFTNIIQVMRSVANQCVLTKYTFCRVQWGLRRVFWNASGHRCTCVYDASQSPGEEVSEA